MGLPLSISKYRATVTESEIFETSFQDDVSTSPNLVFFINDLISLNSFPEQNNILNSEITFQVGNEEIRVAKDYPQKNLNVQLNSITVPQDVYQLLTEKIGETLDKETLKNLIIDCVRENISNSSELSAKIPSNSPSASSQPTSNVDALIAQASQNLTPEENNKLARYREINLKVKKMDEEISSYQNEKKDKESIKKDKERLDREIKNIEDKFSSVNLLIESQNRIKSELEKFNNIINDSSISQKVDGIKQGRSQSLISNLKTVRKAPVNNVDEEGKEMPLFIGKWMLGLVFLQIVISSLFFITTFQLVQLFIGIFSAISIVILMLLVNINRYSANPNARFEESMGLKQNTINLKQGTPDENNLMLNAAWARALKGELELIENTINTRLGDKTLSQISEEKERLLREQKNTDEKLKKIEERSLNTEEYYKKRREVDILKIEKENIEFALEGKMNKDLEDQITTALSPVEEAPKASNLPLLILNCNFVNELSDLLASLRSQRQVLLINFA